MARVDGVMPYEFAKPKWHHQHLCPCHAKPGTYVSLYLQTQHQILIPSASGHDTGASEQF